jgi:hypothetical protein
MTMSILPVSAEDSQIGPALGALPEIEFSQLSQRDPNPLGEKALAIHPEQWKHAETEHFIYHFAQNFVAASVSVEAEFYYDVIAKELQKEQAARYAKSHVYLFERPEDWQQFQLYGKLEPWTGGIYSEGSLFILRDPSYKFAGNALGHEIAHLILHRFYGDRIPSWLNEGFAQYVSKNMRASFQRARGYSAAPRSPAVAPQDYFPLAALLAMKHPPAARAEVFYNESERLVRFLDAMDATRFLALIEALARSETFDTALARIYVGEFSSVAQLEEKFREYATKDFGTTLQQVSD